MGYLSFEGYINSDDNTNKHAWAPVDASDKKVSLFVRLLSLPKLATNTT
jgi:hypothetical protein